MSQDMTSLSAFIANKLTSPFNQHCTMMTVGRTGSGKSMANLKICEDLSIRMAAILGGDPQDYFSIDNVAVITKNEVKRVVRRFTKHGIYLFDDIGVAWNARNFRDSMNVILNDLFQTFRLNSNLVAVTLPDSFLIDKVPRSLVHYFMEMDQSMFQKGMTTAKLFEVVRKPRSGDTYYQYPYNHGKYVRYVFGLPSNELVSEYNQRREAMYQELQEERLAKWDAMDEKEAQADIPKPKKKDLLPKIGAAIADGLTKTQACKKFGMTTRYYNQLMMEEGGSATPAPHGDL